MVCLLVLLYKDIVGESDVELDHPGDDSTEGGEEGDAVPEVQTWGKWIILQY